MITVLSMIVRIIGSCVIVMNNEFLEKEFRKFHVRNFSLQNSVLRDEILYIENNPKQYDLSYNVEKIELFEYGNILFSIIEYMKNRKFYIPITIIIRNNKYVEDGIYILSVDKNMLFRIKKVDANILKNIDQLDHTQNFYLTFYIDIKYAVYFFKEQAYTRSMLEVGRLLNYVNSQKNYTITEYECNMFTFSKNQGIDITMFALCGVLGVRKNER